MQSVWHNGPEYWVRGKTLGGSSSLNGMVYVRGQPSDYDEWNCDGWRWADLKPHYKALENHERGASDMPGTGGPLNITIHPTQLPVLEAMIDAAAEMDVLTVDDLNSIAAQGLDYHPRNILKGTRLTTATVSLRPTMQLGRATARD